MDVCIDLPPADVAKHGKLPLFVSPMMEDLKKEQLVSIPLLYVCVYKQDG